jgi:hypothetical protein
MKFTTPLHCLLLATASLALPAAAQIQYPGNPIPPEQSQGQFSNLGVGMTVVDANQTALWVRAPGANGGVPLEWNSTTFGAATGIHPNYSFAELTRWAPLGMPPRFGGISTGGDVTPHVDPSGKMQMQPNLWYMLSIVLASNAQGQAGSLLNSRVGQGINPATEIMSYYTEGSTGIHPRFVNSVRIEYTGTQLALKQGLPVTTATREIANHDFAMGVISTDLNGNTGAMFPIRNRFYFTLTESYALELRNLNINVASEAARSSNVYMLTWDSSTLLWTGPTIEFHRSQLFPPPMDPDVEIDALSVYVDPANNSSRVVFSLTAASDTWPNQVHDQILVYQGSGGVTTCPTTALKTNAGNNVSSKFGLKPRTAAGTGTGTPDDVKSTCGGDPRDANIIPPVMGLATEEYRQGAGELGFTAVRRTPPLSSSDELHIQVNGLDLEGHTFGYVWLQLEGAPVPKGTPAPLPIPLGDPIPIDAASLSRNAFDLMIPVPSTVGPTPVRFSVQLWGATPGNPAVVQMLRESWVLGVRM